MYRALAIVAALAVVAAALAPLLTQGLWEVVVVRVFGFGGSAKTLLARGGALSLTFGALVTGAMTFAVVVAAQTGRKGWLAALFIAGALAVYAPIIFYFPFVYANARANASEFWYPYNAVYGALLIEAAAPVIAAILALVFALTGLRRAEAAPRVVTGG
jgi:hypothetical protein